jgi:hypothetical protein
LSIWSLLAAEQELLFMVVEAVLADLDTVQECQSVLVLSTQ